MDMKLSKELERKFSVFLKNIGKEDQIKYAEFIIICDSDKCNQYHVVWEKSNIPFVDGVMIYLITKMKPYCEEARVTISQSDFVIKYFEIFKGFLP